MQMQQNQVQVDMQAEEEKVDEVEIDKEKVDLPPILPLTKGSRTAFAPYPWLKGLGWVEES